MPLSKPGLTLQASPRAVADARRWVADLCEELERIELVECAELGVSELVTNALLHGSPPVRVRIRGTRNHPRVEVLDRSAEPPLPLDQPDQGEEALLTTFGRGLSLVAMAAVAWGASIEDAGKVVWFEPAPEIREEPAAGVFDTQTTDEVASPSEGTVEVSLLGIDIDLYTSLVNQYAELRRELRILSLAHEETYPLAGDLSATFASFERLFPPELVSGSVVREDIPSTHVDLSVAMRPEGGPVLTTMLEMFDLADAFCRSERLLSLQRTASQRQFHRWMLNEFINQLRGAPATPWPRSPGVELPSRAS